MTYHTIILAGNVGRDAEMRYTAAGQAVTSFSLATSHQFTRDGEKVKETTWFRISAWGKLAEICNQYVRKGGKVLVEGRLSSDPTTGGPKIWNTKDGSQKASFEVIADQVRFLGGDPAPAAPVPVEGEVDDYPF
jgi:single-strand DNA-binding protein